MQPLAADSPGSWTRLNTTERVPSPSATPDSPPELVFATMRAARDMGLPHQTFVLDDGDSDGRSTCDGVLSRTPGPAAYGSCVDTRSGQGNHFAAWQEPNLFTTEVRAHSGRFARPPWWTVGHLAVTFGR